MGDGQLSADPMHISTPVLTFTGDRNGCVVSIRGNGAQIDLSTTTVAPPVLMNGEGQFFFVDLVDQHEFAFPAKPTTGTIILDTATYQVTGTSWFDRQWGGLPGLFAAGAGDGDQALSSNGESPPKVMNWIWNNPQPWPRHCVTRQNCTGAGRVRSATTKPETSLASTGRSSRRPLPATRTAPSTR
jgi:hypothetical protein